MAQVYYPKNSFVYRRDTSTASYEQIAVTVNPNVILYFTEDGTLTGITASHFPGTASWAETASYSAAGGSGTTFSDWYQLNDHLTNVAFDIGSNTYYGFNYRLFNVTPYSTVTIGGFGGLNIGATDINNSEGNIKTIPVNLSSVTKFEFNDVAFGYNSETYVAVPTYELGAFSDNLNTGLFLKRSGSLNYEAVMMINGTGSIVDTGINVRSSSFGTLLIDRPLDSQTASFYRNGVLIATTSCSVYPTGSDSTTTNNIMHLTNKGGGTTAGVVVQCTDYRMMNYLPYM